MNSVPDRFKERFDALKQRREKCNDRIPDGLYLFRDPIHHIADNDMNCLKNGFKQIFERL